MSEVNDVVVTIDEEKASNIGLNEASGEKDNAPHIIVFVNTRSGGQAGASLLEPMRNTYGEENVFDIFEPPIGPKDGLEIFMINKKTKDLRILVAGGDGTVNWVIDTIDTLCHANTDVAWPAIAILPLGTGNDLSRQFKWGHGYHGQDLEIIKNSMKIAKIDQLDRWQLTIHEVNEVESKVNDKSDNKKETEDKDKNTTPVAKQEKEIELTEKTNTTNIVTETKVDKNIAKTETETETKSELGKEILNRKFVNYFGIGVDGKMVTKFEECRKSCSWMFCCRCMNNMIYGFFGFINPCLPNALIDQEYDVTLNNNNHKCKVPKRARGIMILNIQSFMGGVQLWSKKEEEATSHDEKVDATSVNGTLHLGLIKVDLGTADCLGQGKDVTIYPKQFPSTITNEQKEIKKQTYIAAQVDGEALAVPLRSCFRVKLANKIPMLVGPVEEPPLCDLCC